MSSLQKTRKNY